MEQTVERLAVKLVNHQKFIFASLVEHSNDMDSLELQELEEEATRTAFRAQEIRKRRE